MVFGLADRFELVDFFDAFFAFGRPTFLLVFLPFDFDFPFDLDCNLGRPRLVFELTRGLPNFVVASVRMDEVNKFECPA